MMEAQTVAKAFDQMLGVAIGKTSVDGTFRLVWTTDIGMAGHGRSGQC
jgi:hypothetical protein